MLSSSMLTPNLTSNPMYVACMPVDVMRLTEGGLSDCSRPIQDNNLMESVERSAGL